MGAAEQRQKDSKMAADLVRRGIWHGKRLTKGLSNIPTPTDVGSAAYRRLLEKARARRGN
jgi:hypothetical protein